ncbi:MAG TPA: single-stranded-DNA-specific exonuclease RecJ [Candidatus Saccharimonadales bacterium]|nr:single-stranded-DNA-specific exonuclease RecJ [Candidatus Saccharimonadales bacterium]
MSGVIDQILVSRKLTDAQKRAAFCSPNYEASQHDPFLLPDMAAAVARIMQAKEKNELVYIYGDYDIDGITATTILLDAFKSFGIRREAFIPNRFVEGYGLHKDAIKELAKRGAQLIVTVDCGSLSHAEVELANSLGVDVIVTDHHNVAEVMPPAIATVNPKRIDHEYPFKDLAGCGVAFKLVQALQTQLDGLPAGHEKWLLDLVAFGTVCDVVTLVDENRTNVFWGLQVMQKTRRPGLKALMAITQTAPESLNARTLGFVFGPRLNAAGRLETAQHSLDLLTATDPMKALQIAQKLQDMNVKRRADQDQIFKAASAQAEQFAADPVLVLSGEGWSHGIIGIVAAKILEKYHKPTFVIEEMGEESKGSARSFGDFSAADAIRAADQWLIKGGGHKLAAGVTLKTKHVPQFRQAVNDFYKAQKIKDQLRYLEPATDAIVQNAKELNFELHDFLKTLEPFGNGNPEPILCLQTARIFKRQTLGKEGTHLKLEVSDAHGNRWSLIGFSMAQKYLHDVGDEVGVWFTLIKNEWRGNIKLEGQLIKVVSV